jgi:hypothetical protein
MPSEPSKYAGPERRRRRVYVTQNHEYHCKDGVCVAVRDLRSGKFLTTHRALGKQATVCIAMKDGGIDAITPLESANPGKRVHFAEGTDDEHDVLTSELTAVERPPLQVVEAYAEADLETGIRARR